MGLVGVGVCLVIYLFYQYYSRQQKIKTQILQHIDHIRQHQVLIKPNQAHNTYSGKFAGRRLQFSLGAHIEIQSDIANALETDKLWIYPIKHPFKNDKFIAMLEKNRAWTGNSDFDTHYILAGRSRHFANAVLQPAKRVQSQLLKYPHSVVLINENGVTLQPNPLHPSELTSKIWRDWMGLISDIAQYAEAQYDVPIFSGIVVDESAYPKHDGGHVH